MSEYRRFFSYIYAYEEQQKTTNVGFAKIEMKGAVTAITLHLHTNQKLSGTLTLCLFVHHAAKLLGFSVGEIAFSGGAADRRFTINEDIFADSGCGICDASGIILLCSDTIRFVSQWTEMPINWRAFTLYQPVQSTAVPKQAPARMIPQMPAQTAPKNLADRLPKSPEILSLQTKKNASDPSVSVIQSAELAMPQQMPEKYQKKIAVQISANEKKISLEQRWQEMLQAYPQVQPFSDAQLECVRIELKDLRLLPPSNWHLCNNSFLLHAFLTYRHLIFGKLPAAKSEKWFLGVPGIRYRQEHVLASIFGFFEFLPDKESTDADAPFGYWYVPISEAD